MSKYLLGYVGEELRRLNLQSALFEKETYRTLKLAGIKEGMRCADLGCGVGAASFMMAKMVGPKGSVTGIDVNKNSIDACKKLAYHARIKNVNFFVGSVYNTKLDQNSFDLVYSRFLFQHLSEPKSAIKQMRHIAKKNGILIVEELDHGTWLSYPEDPNLERLRQAYVELLKLNGSDPLIARKLYKMFFDLGLNPQVQTYSVCVTYQEPFYKLGVQLAESIKTKVIESKLMSKEEFEQILNGLKKWSRNRKALVVYALTFRVWSNNSSVL